MAKVTPEVFPEICATVASGVPVVTAIKKHGCGPHSFYALLSNHPDLRKQYLAAREVGCDAMADESLRIAADYRIPSDHKKVHLTQINWLLEKFKPEQYGQRQAIDMRLLGNISISIDTSPPPPVLDTAIAAAAVASLAP